MGRAKHPQPKQGYILMGRPVYYVVLLVLGGSMSFFMLKTVAAAIIPTGISMVCVWCTYGVSFFMLKTVAAAVIPTGVSMVYAEGGRVE